MELDLSRLYNITAPEGHTEPLGEEAKEPVAESEKGLETPHRSPEGQVADNMALAKLNMEQEDHERAKEVYKTYQKNIKASSLLRSEILKGVRAGEATEALFLKACETISYMTGDNAFYSQIEGDLESRKKEA